jgi:hypothetical protein
MIVAVLLASLCKQLLALLIIHDYIIMIMIKIIMKMYSA